MNHDHNATPTRVLIKPQSDDNQPHSSGIGPSMTGSAVTPPADADPAPANQPLRDAARLKGNLVLSRSNEGAIRSANDSHGTKTSLRYEAG